MVLIAVMKKKFLTFALMSIFCVGGGEFFRYAQKSPPSTQNIAAIAVPVKCHAKNKNEKKCDINFENS